MKKERYKEGQAPTTFTLKNVLLKLYRLIAQPRVVHRERLIVSDDSDVCDRPIFIIGPHRSGTTLMRQIIDSHSNIACPPESYFLYHLARATEEKSFFIGLEEMGYDRSAVISGLKRSTAFFYENYRLSKNKGRWADKTPIYSLVLPFIEEMFGPECRYVMVYRHPFDVIQSLLTKGWSFMHYHDDEFLNVVHYLKDVLDRMEAFKEEHADRCHDLRYETLMEDAEGVVKELFRFLDETWEPEVLRFHEKQHDWGTGDPEAQVLKGFRPSMGNWKKWSQEHIAQASEVLGRHLERKGYSNRVEDLSLS